MKTMKVNGEGYKNEDGWTIEREFGKVLDIPFEGKWALRNPSGIVVDSDFKRIDLEVRNGFLISVTKG